MPITMALRMIAEGIVRKGSLASEPSEAALSKPTKLKSASTRPSRTWSAVTPVRSICARSTMLWLREQRRDQNEQIRPTEANSIARVVRIES